MNHGRHGRHGRKADQGGRARTIDPCSLALFRGFRVFRGSAALQRQRREAGSAEVHDLSVGPGEPDGGGGGPKSLGCMSCHTATDRHTMHQNPGVILGCADCHGGDPKVTVAQAISPESRRVQGGARAGARAAALHEDVALALVGHARAHVRQAQSRVARVRALHQPGRPAHRARGVRRLPPADHPGLGAQHHGHVGHALGRRLVQQRHPAVQALHPRRGLHARRARAPRS